MSFRWWPWSATRWLEHGLSHLTTTLLAAHPSLSFPSSFSISTYLVPPPSWMDPHILLRLPAAILSLSIVDDVYWSLVTAIESIALVSVVCSFYLLCGCTI